MANLCIYQNQEEQSACDVLNVFPSASKLIFLKVQLLRVKSSQSFVFVVILKLKLKKGLQKATHKVRTLGLFFPKNISLPFLHKMLIAKVFQTFCGWFRMSLSFLYQTIHCDASHCCECMHCLLTLTFLKALYMHLLIWGNA